MASATFLAADNTTQGSWVGVYGAAGIDKLEFGISNNPSGMSEAKFLGTGWSIANINTAQYCWEADSSDVRALQRTSGVSRDADTWYSNTADDMIFHVIPPSDATQYTLRAYMLDWESAGRVMDILLSSDVSGSLGTYSTASYGTGGYFNNGLWLSWGCSGDIYLQFHLTGGPNTVLGGIFLDAYTAPTTSTVPNAIAGISATGVLPTHRLS